tara:strand:+ start:234 stop:389 length:156 start_codon:yes stop_codon:yes gene_type:complete
MSLIARAISWIDHKNIIIQIYIYLDYFALLLAAAGCWLLLLRRLVESLKNF